MSKLIYNSRRVFLTLVGLLLTTTQIIAVPLNNTVSDERGGQELTSKLSSPNDQTLTIRLTAQGKLLQWRAGLQTHVVGYNIYRSEGGEQKQLNRELIPGPMLRPGFGAAIDSVGPYRWLDDDPRTEIACYWLETIDSNGNHEMTPPIQSQLGESVGYGTDSAAETVFLKSREEHRSQGHTSRAERTAALAQLSRNVVDAHLRIASQPGVKIRVAHEGWYRVTRQQLAAAGFDTTTDPRLLQLYVDGEQQAALLRGEDDGRFDDDDTVEFYGVGLDSPSTNQRTYWLISGDQPGLRIKRTKVKGRVATAKNFVQTVERRDRKVYFSKLLNGDRENFFGSVITNRTLAQIINIPNVAQSNESALVEFAVQGVTDTTHRVTASLNGESLGSISFEGQTEGKSAISIPQTRLREGENLITFVAQAGPADISLVDYVRVAYKHTYAADNDLVLCTTPGKQRTSITGFSSPAVHIFDITNPARIHELPGDTAADGANFSITFNAPKGDRPTMLALEESQIRRPESIDANWPSKLRASASGAELLIISRREFFESLELLRMLRETQGVRVALIDVEDVYDEFSFGQKSPDAIRDFLLYAKLNWQSPPRFVLFAGDSSIDPKNYLGHGDFDLVPSKTIDTVFMETQSDDWFADFNHRGIPDIPLGRLPVRTPAEAQLVVSKIASYEQLPPSASVMLVADLNDDIDFEGPSDQLATLIHTGLAVDRVYRGQLGDAPARSELRQYLNRGEKLVNYFGHGQIDVWRGELLTTEDARTLTNTAPLPVFLLITCLNGYFMDPALDSLAEGLLTSETGGAVAVWASTGFCDADPQAVLNQEMFKLLLSQTAVPGITLGEAAVRAKGVVSDPDVRRTYVLLGDPSMRLR